MNHIWKYIDHTNLDIISIPPNSLKYQPENDP